MIIKRLSYSEYLKVLTMRHFCIIHGWAYDYIPNVVDRKMLFGHYSYSFDDMVKRYDWILKMFDLELLEHIVERDRTVFGTAYYNAAMKANKGNMAGNVQPKYTSVREEFSILLQKMKANGFELKQLSIDLYMDNQYFIKRRRHKKRNKKTTN